MQERAVGVGDFGVCVGNGDACGAYRVVCLIVGARCPGTAVDIQVERRCMETLERVDDGRPVGQNVDIVKAHGFARRDGIKLECERDRLIGRGDRSDRRVQTDAIPNVGSVDIVESAMRDSRSSIFGDE